VTTPFRHSDGNASSRGHTRDSTRTDGETVSRMASHHYVTPDLAGDASILKGMERQAVRLLEERGTVVEGTLRRQMHRANPNNPADYDDEGNFIDLVLVRFSADVVPARRFHGPVVAP
jgi:hypothetical protein